MQKDLIELVSKSSAFFHVCVHITHHAIYRIHAQLIPISQLLLITHDPIIDLKQMQMMHDRGIFVYHADSQTKDCLGITFGSLDLAFYVREQLRKLVFL